MSKWSNREKGLELRGNFKAVKRVLPYSYRAFFHWPEFFRRAYAFQYHIPQLPSLPRPLSPPEKFSSPIVSFVFHRTIPVAVFLIFFCRVRPYMQFHSDKNTTDTRILHLPLCVISHRPFKPRPDFTMYIWLILNTRSRAQFGSIVFVTVIYVNFSPNGKPLFALPVIYILLHILVMQIIYCTLRNEYTLYGVIIFVEERQYLIFIDSTRYIYLILISHFQYERK